AVIWTNVRGGATGPSRAGRASRVAGRGCRARQARADGRDLLPPRRVGAGDALPGALAAGVGVEADPPHGVTRRARRSLARRDVLLENRGPRGRLHALRRGGRPPSGRPALPAVVRGQAGRTRSGLRGGRRRRVRTPRRLLGA